MHFLPSFRTNRSFGEANCGISLNVQIYYVRHFTFLIH